MTSIELEVLNPSGLHARPAALFVRTAGGYRSRIRVRNVTRGTGDVDGKSIISVLTLIGYLLADIGYAIADPRVSYDG